MILPFIFTSNSATSNPHHRGGHHGGNVANGYHGNHPNYHGLRDFRSRCAHHSGLETYHSSRYGGTEVHHGRVPHTGIRSHGSIMSVASKGTIQVLKVITALEAILVVATEGYEGYHSFGGDFGRAHFGEVISVVITM